MMKKESKSDLLSTIHKPIELKHITRHIKKLKQSTESIKDDPHAGVAVSATTGEKVKIVEKLSVKSRCLYKNENVNHSH